MVRDLGFLVVLSLALVTGCGAKTGLRIPDAGVDAGMCVPRPATLIQRGAQIMFVVDRSNSMNDTLDGRTPDPAESNRWQILGDVLGQVLRGGDPRVELGAEIYPDVNVVIDPQPEDVCGVSVGVDLPIGLNNVEPLLSLFASTNPQGGTPTAEALRNVAEYFDGNPAPGISRFAILATDGGPNCNPDTGVPTSVCVCTGNGVNDCNDPVYGPYNCLDEVRTYDAIRRLATDQQIPVYVIGIDDPSRPDLGDVLDEMAVLGSRPRDVVGERQFYSVRETEDLRGALETITRSIARCVFTLEPSLAVTDRLIVTVGGATVPPDVSHSEGWDFTGGDRGEITLFGEACARATEQPNRVEAIIPCPE